MLYRIPYDENSNNFHIKEIIKQRKIQNLTHFTKIENLESILTNGLLSRKYLDSNKIKHAFNDNERWDNKINATCLSIEFPNEFLLKKFKEKYINAKWVIILLDIKLLNNNCNKYFCNKNAGGASSWLNCDYSQTFHAFESLFNEKINSKSLARSDQLYIKKYLPTDVQAEILIEDNIQPKFIKKLIFETQNDLEICKSSFVDKGLLEKYNPIVNSQFYNSRQNFFWEDR